MPEAIPDCAPVHALRAALAGSGVDVLQPFAVQAYNQLLAADARCAPLETYARAATCAVLVGNTRALWAPLMAALRADESLRASGDPVDDYVQARLQRAAAASGVPHSLYMARERASNVSLLHAAGASGLARVGPAGLAVHPELGPWFGLRAVIVFDAGCAPAAQPAPPLPCNACSRPCEPLFARALAAHAADGGGSILGSWRAWLAVRDACPVGRAHRYDEAQLEYHYTKDLARLR